MQILHRAAHRLHIGAGLTQQSSAKWTLITYYNTQATYSKSTDANKLKKIYLMSCDAALNQTGTYRSVDDQSIGTNPDEAGALKHRKRRRRYWFTIARI